MPVMFRGLLGSWLLTVLLLPGAVSVAAQQVHPILRFVVGSDVEAIDPANAVVTGIDTAWRRVCLNAGVFVLAAVMVPAAAFGPEEELLVVGAHVSPDGAELGEPTLAQMTLRPGSAQGWRSFEVNQPGCFEVVVTNGRASVYQLGVLVSE